MHLPFLTFLLYKYLITLRSSERKLICKKAFPRSPTIAMLRTLKRKRAPNNDDRRDGPVCKEPISEDETSIFALASNTILNFVAVLSYSVTGLCCERCVLTTL